MGCTETPAYPVMVASLASRSVIRCRHPSVWCSGAKGWMEQNSGQEMASISAVALSFMVHEPSGIMVRSRARSYPERRRR